ncbi:carboxypeptidase-like regulatory domain-containing protein [Pedobacter sp. KR3-3]|uniref:Carboxypeptidase-like regulatory domain-containing protein n=1 Tax=Pedobacter albus TaxID=3113905 RepID=A0ABU7I631_9SPHI|nr:carboxypeptidase-like regulatory domain-containing protein [Pedobacter sp. KR3-3]MEE1944928.1 carboxypeptidase-like regulatory domain-containing protein [Pedobacter sp. KR3-3]
MQQLRISIPKPCTQNWADLSPAEKGRYCSSCQKEVIDFRGWTADELQDWFANSNGRVCGRLSQKQLDYFKPKEVRHEGWSFSAKVLLASSLALLTSSKVYSNTFAKSDSAIHQNTNEKGSKIKEEAKPSDSLIIIKGIITAKEDKLPLPDVSIFLKNSSVSGSTGDNGRFTLQVKATPGQKLLLEFKCLGYATKELEITPESVAQELELEMAFSDEGLTMGAVVVSYRRYPLHKRIWNFIKSPFVKHR